ncbi:MAG: type II secretion system ATPase GspE [Bradymonadales bacterium]|nr:type II secretion system ATPase GspE [Bradymonadales bacterium]
MYNRPLLGEILIQRGVLNETGLSKALARQTEAKGLLGEILVEMDLAKPTQVAEALAVQHHLSYLHKVEVDHLDLSLLGPLPIAYARQKYVLPLNRVDSTVRVLIKDPLDLDAIDHLSFLYSARIEPVVATPQVVMEAINAAFDLHDRARSDYGSVLGESAGVPGIEETGFEEIQDMLGNEEDDEAPVIKFVNTTFVRAVRERASDIHLEPYENHLSVRFRVDGVLKEVIQVPKRFQSSISARVKIMSGLNIAEKRLPQDGRIRLKIAGRDIDIRVATAPTTQGERITLRLLDQSSVLLGLEQLGLDPRTMIAVNRIIRKPHGILLVTGPTGSGKTTTLYACLSIINSPDKNILTIEDPVEYQLKGISQTPVNPKIDLTFASGLRSFLRHDPDVIMVGEIRDVETAEIAIQASLTGHLVFSTIHTNDAAGAFTRLIDMGVEPFLVASSLLANLAQRLVRRLCPSCRVPYRPTVAELAEIGLKPEDLRASGGIIYRPGGCDDCLNTGYKGRSGIFELLEVTDDVRSLVMQRADANTIKKAAMAQGMRPLRMDGADKVVQGATSIEEVLRVTQEEVE